MDSHLHDAEVIISQPFFPYYLTAERIARAPKLKLALTAGIGSDHVDLEAAALNGVDVAEVRLDYWLLVVMRPVDKLYFASTGHLVQQYQRCRTRCDDDPRTRS